MPNCALLRISPQAAAPGTGWWHGIVRPSCNIHTSVTGWQTKPEPIDDARTGHALLPTPTSAPFLRPYNRWNRCCGFWLYPHQGGLRGGHLQLAHPCLPCLALHLARRLARGPGSDDLLRSAVSSTQPRAESGSGALLHCCSSKAGLDSLAIIPIVGHWLSFRLRGIELATIALQLAIVVR